MYRLRCLECGTDYPDDGLMAACPRNHEPALLRAVYPARFRPNLHASGIARYAAWLPARGALHPVGRTAVFQSAVLCEQLDAPNLWLAFNGLWPERGAHLPTGTFKDLEASAVLARFPHDRVRLVTASAGNTAAALAALCEQRGIPAVIVVPPSGALKIRPGRRGGVRVVVLRSGSTYDDAIAYARAFAARTTGYAYEGGAGNVARRDGIGTTMLAIAERLRRLPDRFVAAIGSGTGAIAAHEAALRLREDGSFGRSAMRMTLVQNAPSAPVYDAWRAGSATLIEQRGNSRDRYAALIAPVLGAQAPPYAVRGGLRDVLAESEGTVCIAENGEAQAASDLFYRLEGVRLENAAAVALAGLLGEYSRGAIDRAENVVLHVTGGLADRARARRTA